MKKQLIILAMLTTISMASAANSPQTRMLRFPTSNSSEIVFSYAGDLYRVPINGGQASRLTSHIGYEMFPRFSPDGKTIAFTGQYDGNTEVFTIPSTGGEPQRLTYTATNSRDDLGDRMGPNNIVITWSPDGKNIVYRNRISTGFDGKLYTVPHSGGLSDVIPLPEGGFCSYSPDGKKMAYNRVMREFRNWKYYKGGMADDIWIYDPTSKKVENITNNVSQDIMPMWIGDQIFFISDRDRTMNIFCYNTATKAIDKVTNFTEFDVKFPSANANTIVFENGGYIYKLDATSRKVEKVDITLTSDNIYARTEIKNGADYITNISSSPDGARVVATARGEVFDLPVAKGVTRNITRTPGSHERGAQWSPEGTIIVYLSDQSGETELWSYNPSNGQNQQLTKNNDTYIRSFTWSPDGKSIVYTDRKNRVNILDLATKKVTMVIQDPKGEPRSVSFSPDSKWLTYTRSAENDFSMIFLYNLADKKEYPVTDKWYACSSPLFSTDGKYLIFNSSREFNNPIYGSTEWNHVYTNTNGLYMALLSRDTPSPMVEKDAQVGVANKKEEKKADQAVVVQFDADGIADRILRVPTQGASRGAAYCDGSKIYYGASGGVKTFDLNTLKNETILEGASMRVAPGATKAIFTRGNNYYVGAIPSGKTELRDPIDLSNIKITVDYAQEWPQIFDEAWRAYRDGFYVENMHGVDWKAIKTKYAALLPYVKTRLDLNYLIGEMIGELNCGHAYVNPGETQRPDRIQTGLLGAQVSRDQKSGYFRLEKILEGASWSSKLRSPLREPGLKVSVGDYIVAVDGVPTNSTKDIYALLVGKANVPTELTINSTSSDQGARKVVINPLDNEYPLYHYQWVQDNIEKVDKASGGKIGYIYIPDMGVDGLNEFARYFYPQLDKEGLIIDDRANGGGNVSPMILERLAREVYRVSMSRGSDRISTIPDATLTGPKVCLINKYSASDGDLFPWGFRALGLGKLIGTRTWGGIVGISGSLPYMDGTDIRVPFFTSFDPKTGDWIVENHGVDPDIVIDNDPIKEWDGEDQQLNRAIEEVLKEIPNRKALPTKAPAPRNWSK